MKPCFVNGERHLSLGDALKTTGGTYVGLKKAINCGLKYRGFRVSYDPDVPKWTVPDRLKGQPLLKDPKVSP